MPQTLYKRINMARSIKLDFSDEQLQQCVAGIRPFRKKTYRIESESFSGKTLIHNYGHGGCGVSTSWGSAQEVLTLANETGAKDKSIAVLGAGVNGLTSAIVLAETGYQVAIYTAETSPNTTSDIAGAQWAPSFIEFGETEQELKRFHQILQSSLDAFESLLGSEYGVYRRTNYVEDGHSSFFDRLPTGMLPPPKTYSKLPFANTNVSGRSFETLLIEMPRYMKRLMQRVADNDISIEIREFKTANDFNQLEEAIIINCLGFGAAAVMNDPLMEPIRGQLALLPPIKNQDWLFSHKTGYIFPREDALVVGGSVERGEFKRVACPDACRKIVKENQELFSR